MLILATHSFLKAELSFESENNPRSFFRQKYVFFNCSQVVLVRCNVLFSQLHRL